MSDLRDEHTVNSLRLLLLNSSVAVGAALLAAHIKLHTSIRRSHSHQLLAEFRA